VLHCCLIHFSRSPRRGSGRRRSRSRSNSRKRSRSPPKVLFLFLLSLTVKPAKVHVGKLTRNVTKEHLHEIFSSFGTVKGAEIPMVDTSPLTLTPPRTEEALACLAMSNSSRLPMQRKLWNIWMERRWISTFGLICSGGWASHHRPARPPPSVRMTVSIISSHRYCSSSFLILVLLARPLLAAALLAILGVVRLDPLLLLVLKLLALLTANHSRPSLKKPPSLPRSSSLSSSPFSLSSPSLPCSSLSRPPVPCSPPLPLSRPPISLSFPSPSLNLFPDVILGTPHVSLHDCCCLTLLIAALRAVNSCCKSFSFNQ
jgi:hypothetical protein